MAAAAALLGDDLHLVNDKKRMGRTAAEMTESNFTLNNVTTEGALIETSRQPRQTRHLNVSSQWPFQHT